MMRDSNHGMMYRGGRNSHSSATLDKHSSPYRPRVAPRMAPMRYSVEGPYPKGVPNDLSKLMAGRIR